MEAHLTFTPPQLPKMMTGEQLSHVLVGIYPELQSQEGQLRDLVSAMDVYDAARGEYQARNAHYGEWMHWYKENPTEKDKVVAFAAEHSAHYESARGALQALADAVDRVIKAWGDRGDLANIRTVLANVESSSHELAQNLQALQSANPPGRPRILPQKRPSASP